MPERQSFVIERTLADGTVEQARVLRWEAFQRWRRRATFAFVGLAAVAALGLYLAQHAGTASDHNLRREARRAVTRSCVDRMDVRIAVAVGFDELRRLAVRPPRTPAERGQVAAFIERTEAPIDTLLSQAAGATIKTVGGVRPRDIEQVRKLGGVRCAALGQRFDDGASASD